ncbi:DUF881 domain-containing protein [Microlunatus sp. Y2014]|uniref:DUF881 domain-containing protein n=1 Tax=Microlunatus sp. Y2014 TaxID=3418488 RepID=UPI003DA75DA0
MPDEKPDATPAEPDATSAEPDSTSAEPDSTDIEPVEAPRDELGEREDEIGEREEDEPAHDTLAGFLRLLFKPTRAQLAAALVLCLVGFAVVTQVQSQQNDSDYSNARREDLIQLLDQLNAETRRLESESAELERTRQELTSGADAQEVARVEAQRRLDMLAILAGTAPAEGPGIRMVINDPEGKVTTEVLLDAIEEMRDAGGEVIEINDEIRLVASSWVAMGPEGLLVDDVLVTSPITIEVIGDSHALSEAARFRGGLVSEITGPRIGGTVDLVEVSNLQIQSLHTPKANQYAQPAERPR